MQQGAAKGYPLLSAKYLAKLFRSFAAFLLLAALDANGHEVKPSRTRSLHASLGLDGAVSLGRSTGIGLGVLGALVFCWLWPGSFALWLVLGAWVLSDGVLVV
jgi:hypothetical protein